MDENVKKLGAEELARIEFDFFKHLTTLSAAAAAAVLAVYREVAFDQLSLIITLLCFAGSIGLALGGMLKVTSGMRRWTRGEAEYYSSESLTRIATLAFGTGISSLVFNTLLDLLPTWLQGVIIGGIALFFVVFFIVVRLMVTYSRRKVQRLIREPQRHLNETREDLDRLQEYLNKIEEVKDLPPEELHNIRAESDRLRIMVEERQEELDKMFSALDNEPQKKSWWRKVFTKKATRDNFPE